MNKFEFLMVIISVILGLGITQVLYGIVDYIQNRSRIRFSLLQLTWMAILFLLQIQYWWEMYKMQILGNGFHHFLAALVYPSLLYVTAGILVPSVPDDGDFDLGERYLANHRWFFGCCLIGMAFLVFYEHFVWGKAWSSWRESVDSDFNKIRLLGCGLLFLLMLIGNRWVHRLLTFGCLVALGYHLTKTSL